MGKKKYSQGRYYSDMYKGQFAHQRVLNEAIENNNCLLQTSDANPLTIRLLVAKDALNDLSNQVEDANKRLDNFLARFNVCITKCSFTSYSVTLRAIDINQVITSGSAASSRKAVVNDYSGKLKHLELSKDLIYRDNTIYPKDDSTIFRSIIAYMDLYNFFSNFGSVLDRFSHEINMLFALGICPTKVDWGEIKRYREELDNKCSGLYSEINKFHRNYGERYLRYRNRFIHDGLLKISISIESEKWKIFLPQKPDDISSSMTFDAVKQCTNGFSELLNFLDRCYEIINAKITNSGQPPW